MTRDCPSTAEQLEAYLEAGCAELKRENESLRAECDALRTRAKAQHGRDSAELRRLCAERDTLLAELAITRRVIDRIGQLCTTPHESKERFIRRVQSVIEWERAAQQDQPQ